MTDKDLIESLQAQLSASQRRERAAVEDSVDCLGRIRFFGLAGLETYGVLFAGAMRKAV